MTDSGSLEIGQRVRVKGKGSKQYNVVTIVGDYVGLVSDGYIPDPKCSSVEIAVARGQLELLTPVSQGRIEGAPTPQHADIHHF